MRSELQAYARTSRDVSGGGSLAEIPRHCILNHWWPEARPFKHSSVTPACPSGHQLAEPDAGESAANYNSVDGEPSRPNRVHRQAGPGCGPEAGAAGPDERLGSFRAREWRHAYQQTAQEGLATGGSGDAQRASGSARFPALPEVPASGVARAHEHPRRRVHRDAQRRGQAGYESPGARHARRGRSHVRYFVLMVLHVNQVVHFHTG